MTEIRRNESRNRTTIGLLVHALVAGLMVSCTPLVEFDDASVLRAENDAAAAATENAVVAAAANGASRRYLGLIGTHDSEDVTPQDKRNTLWVLVIEAGSSRTGCKLRSRTTEATWHSGVSAQTLDFGAGSGVSGPIGPNGSVVRYGQLCSTVSDNMHVTLHYATARRVKKTADDAWGNYADIQATYKGQRLSMWVWDVPEVIDPSFSFSTNDHGDIWEITVLDQNDDPVPAARFSAGEGEVGEDENATPNEHQDSLTTDMDGVWTVETTHDGVRWNLTRGSGRGYDMRLDGTAPPSGHEITVTFTFGGITHSQTFTTTT